MLIIAVIFVATLLCRSSSRYWRNARTGWGPRSSRSSWMTDRCVWVATNRNKSTKLSR